MRVPWKLVGLAGVAGVAATGVVVARRRRSQQDYEPDELRERLHERLAEVPGENDAVKEGEEPAPGEN
jgi:hypothetical protein